MKPRPTNCLKSLLTAAFTCLAATAGCSAAVFNYYIGTDNLTTIASGAFAGLPNPNAGRLTFLYAPNYSATPASSHYHSKGTFRYRPGSSISAPIIEVGPSNFLPEGSAPPLALVPGSGLYAGKLVVERSASNRFSEIDFRDTSDLSSFPVGSYENFMFNSSGGRWTTGIAGADVHLVLVSMTAGLNIGSASMFDIGLNNPGDEFHLGDDINMSPIFWTDASAAPGPYVAQFKLTDENGVFGDSGTFEFRFNAVPEPSTTLLGAGALLLGLVRRKR